MWVHAIHAISFLLEHSRLPLVVTTDDTPAMYAPGEQQVPACAMCASDHASEEAMCVHHACRHPDPNHRPSMAEVHETLVGFAEEESERVREAVENAQGGGGYVCCAVM